MLVQTGASPSAPRVQLTQSSVHRLQFGGPFCTGEFSAGFAGGMSSSAVRTLEPLKADMTRRATIKTTCRMALSVTAHSGGHVVVLRDPSGFPVRVVYGVPEYPALPERVPLPVTSAPQLADSIHFPSVP